MPSKVLFVTFDCADPRRVAEFWAEALSYEIHAPNEAIGEVELWDPKEEGPNLGFMKVPESKVVKNRVHIDLASPGRLEDEVHRLEGLGARAIETLQDQDGYVDPMIWTVMQDPEGNEFCVIQRIRDRS
ncbi:MAG TPA: VOC family protein [Actinomycetota bacterium]|nr:VOC family protein [Actinomycetota bacterium]